jgi:hypothetical protein
MSLYPLPDAVTRSWVCHDIVQLSQPIAPVVIFKVFRNWPSISFVKETVWVETRLRILNKILQELGRLFIY